MFKILFSLCVLALTASFLRDDKSKPSAGVDAVSSITVLVKDQDEALRWYTDVLGFEKREDQTMGDFRWLTVGPRAQPELAIVLLQAKEDQLALVGKGTTTVVTTGDCRRTFEALKANGVAFEGAVEEMPWGIAANFTDLYGNPYHLLQAAAR